MWRWIFGGPNDGPPSTPTMLARVDKINFEGLDRTKQDILKEIVKPIFKTADFTEVIRNIKLVQQRFYDLGLFRDVKIAVDSIPETSTESLQSLSVSFDVEETRRYAGGIFTSASNNDASVTLELRSPNLLGRAEEIRGQFEYSWKYFASWSTTLSKPLIRTPWPSLNSKLDFTILQAARDAPWSKYKELDRCFLCDLSVQPTENQFHLFRFTNDWRYLFSPTETAFKIREQFGHSLKTSLSHTYVYDLRDSAILPSEGFMFKFFSEYAGFTRNGVSFLKHEAELQHNITVFDGLTLQASIKGGLMKGYQNVTVSDNFFIGGPLTFRGFMMNGVGPHINGCAMGANSYWLGGLHAYLPLPFKNNFNDFLRLHGFVNAGNISNGEPTDFEKLVKDYRLSYGVGLVMSFGNKARLEINYCLPIKSQGADQKAGGLQFGVGIAYT